MKIIKNMVFIKIALIMTAGIIVLASLGYVGVSVCVYFTIDPRRYHGNEFMQGVSEWVDEDYDRFKRSKTTLYPILVQLNGRKCKLYVVDWSCGRILGFIDTSPLLELNECKNWWFQSKLNYLAKYNGEYAYISLTMDMFKKIKVDKQRFNYIDTIGGWKMYMILGAENGSASIEHNNTPA